MTENNKPLILITNDDGVQAKGINELVEGLRPLGNIVVVAPDSPRSGMSCAITSIVPLQINLLKQEDGLSIYSCSGTPVDCVKLGISKVLKRKPDILVSGINHGSNSAVSVIYSGTIGAALEGCILGIPSLGVSLTDHDSDADFSEAVKYANYTVKKMLQEGLPQGICLNLNIPDIPEVKGLKICSQTKGYWAKEFREAQDPNGETNYWLTGEFFNEDLDNDLSDEWALNNGYAAVVPLKIDMTAYDTIEKIKSWNFNLKTESQIL